MVAAFVSFIARPKAKDIVRMNVGSSSTTRLRDMDDVMRLRSMLVDAGQELGRESGGLLYKDRVFRKEGISAPLPGVKIPEPSKLRPLYHNCLNLTAA